MFHNMSPMCSREEHGVNHKCNPKPNRLQFARQALTKWLELKYWPACLPAWISISSSWTASKLSFQPRTHWLVSDCKQEGEHPWWCHWPNIIVGWCEWYWIYIGFVNKIFFMIVCLFAFSFFLMSNKGCCTVYPILIHMRRADIFISLLLQTPTSSGKGVSGWGSCSHQCGDQVSFQEYENWP